MKKEFFLLLIFMLIPALVFAQNNRPRKGPREKIEQLEKVKLIDALDMDEQTTLRFFARRNEFRKNTDALSDSLDSIVDELESGLNKENDSRNKELVNNYLNIEKQIASQHSQFINSLYDILTVKQVAKLIVFEKRFREEIRRFLLRGRQPPPDPEMR